MFKPYVLTLKDYEEDAGIDLNEPRGLDDAEKALTECGFRRVREALSDMEREKEVKLTGDGQWDRTALQKVWEHLLRVEAFGVMSAFCFTRQVPYRDYITALRDATREAVKSVPMQIGSTFGDGFLFDSELLDVTFTARVGCRPATVTFSLSDAMRDRILAAERIDAEAYAKRLENE